MFGSKNSFFKQKIEVLSKSRLDLEELLRIKGRKGFEIQRYITAYDYFVANPEDFDGATIVKDLVDIRVGSEYLDLDAMLHDFDYLSGANVSFIKKFKSDFNYIKNMEKNGKGIRVFRFWFLTISGLVFIPYKKLIK